MTTSIVYQDIMTPSTQPENVWYGTVEAFKAGAQRVVALADRGHEYPLGHYFLWATVAVKKGRRVRNIRMCVASGCNIDPLNVVKAVLQIPGVVSASYVLD